MPTLLQLRSFLAVVDQGGFTTAAQQLNLTQPAVSRAVAGLEKELGLLLLRRHRDGVTLTAAGERAAEHARHAVSHLELMRTEVAALAGQLTGTLRVASLPFATGTMLAPRLRAFSDEYPGVTVHLIEGSEPEIRDWLERGAADVGVVSLPAPGLEAAELGVDEMVAVLPAGHRLAGLDAVSYAELAAEPFIRSTGGCAAVFTPVAAQVGVELGADFEAHEMTAVINLVRAGLGVSILPSPSGPHPGIVARPLIPRTTRTLALAIGRSAGPAARAFLGQAAARNL
ncbi:LysR family transcriptional regulator [Mycolicibacterium conceptionense]|uniref:Probable hydrogen peroxide-inducible genes activator n=1 Tax=Mycolicibacterium conceptionense TaxID=451644 RepID=A0A1A2VHB3_9MYCO|nr:MULTISPECIES: LysR family transcriptional regulator [Mycolicibacterium]MCW1820200.1 LysR substrate-binding domain-containing protein [Mycolicibacterium senegalense]OBB07285.1 LysR family transcriptional regulator [Mycolicibacterium conceptionense]OBF02729.1 LysR family transcriptional regulator [Mycolicibacterium conceptionense]OBF23428.1 LysR family transcriptional regulator [Mycolicibacterium conceptionense]OBF35275.1 LysR family transcriptional regulator [Mycolicibacterium conceptionense